MKYIKKFENNIYDIGDHVRLKESSHSLNSDDKSSFWYGQYGIILDSENIEIPNYGKILMYLIHLESELNSELKDFAINSMVIEKNNKHIPNRNNIEEKYDFWISPNYLDKI